MEPIADMKKENEKNDAGIKGDLPYEFENQDEAHVWATWNIKQI